MTGNFDLWKLLAGLGIFLFGMYLLEEAIKALSGKAFKKVIRSYTNGRLKAIGSGTLVTAILQSSSAVSLMVLAFIGAGVMSMENAIGVIMGSNIGTTFTAWIVATFGFKLKIEGFALPLVAIGGFGLVTSESSSRLSHVCKLLIGFGFLFLGLDYMESSVEGAANSFALHQLPDYGLLVYLAVGLVITALMQSSSASIAIALTALNSRLITFPMGVAMVIGANVGTTVTVLLGSIGGIQGKKRVAASHLLFNVITAVVAFMAIPVLVRIIKLVFDIQSNSVMGLALFHTLFNVMGVILFFPFVGLLPRLLIRIFPDQKAELTVFLGNTPTEVTDAATSALKKEILHLLLECQFYILRLLHIDEKLVFDQDSPIEIFKKKKISLAVLYENIKLLHAEIFAFYSRLQAHKLEEHEAKENERIIFASRNIMNSVKNFKGIGLDLDEFDASGNSYVNAQYKLFRKRLLEIYHDMNRIQGLDSKEEQYRTLLQTFVHIEEADKRFIRETMNAVSAGRIHEMEIASLLLVNRLFTQACRMQVFSMKDLLLAPGQINDFDRALDMKEIMEEEKAKTRGNK